MVNDPSPKQLEAINYLKDSTTNFVGYGGAAFGGKTYLECLWIAHMALAYPDTGWGLARKELTTLKKTTLKTLYKVFEEMNIIEGRDYVFNGQLNVFTFSNKSDIFLIDMAHKPSDPLFTRFGGYELTGAAVDESAECSPESINILFTRLGRRNNSKYKLTAKMLETFNPVKNHVYNRYFKPWRDGHLKPTFAFVRALPTDNPSPDVEQYVKNILDNGDRVTIERLIHGNFEYDDDPNIMIAYDKMVDAFTNEHVNDGTKYLTADIATHGSDMFIIYIWSGWKIIDCLVMEKSDGKQVETSIRNMATKHSIQQSNIIYDADGVGSYLKGYLKNAVSFNNGGKPLDESGKSVQYKNLKTQCYYHLAEKINAGQIYILQNVGDILINGKFVREWITEQSNAIRKQPSISGKLELISKDKMKELTGGSPDFMDAMMMRVYFDLKKINFNPPKTNIGRLW